MIICISLSLPLSPLCYQSNHENVQFSSVRYPYAINAHLSFIMQGYIAIEWYNHKKSDTKSQMEHVLMHTFRSSEPQFFPPLERNTRIPSVLTVIRVVASVNGFRVRRPSSLFERGREINRIAFRFFLFFSFFPRKFIRIVSLINSRHNQGRDRVFRGKKKKKRLAIFPFPKRFASLAFESLVQVEADGWRTWPSGRHDDCPPAMLLIRYSRGNLSERNR